MATVQEEPPPSVVQRGAETTRPVPRSAKSLFSEVDFGGFLRRLGQAMDFWRDEDERGVDIPRLKELCLEALDKRGKMTSLVAIAKVADAYTSMDGAQRTDFYGMLCHDFHVEEPLVTEAIEAYRAESGDRSDALLRLTLALESPRLHLLRLFNTIPSGVKFVIDLRADLLTRLKTQPELKVMEFELHHILSSWFNPGFLQLKRVTWDSPAAFLENLVAYEAVHEIGNWRDLKHRLISDRACFAFVHAAMPNEPVIFVEVALVKGMTDNIQRLLDPDAPDLHPEQADTAIFYSISNAQKGLRSIQFGNLLIKQVAVKLRGEFTRLNTFATLSPVPRLRKDFLAISLADGSIQSYFKNKEGERLCALTGRPTVKLAVDYLLALPDWYIQTDAANALKPGLLRAARAYLTEFQREGHVACAVAHFHGSNGAQLARINWLGDTSPKGIDQSAGIMVNYLYDLDKFERHQSEYARSGRVPVGKAVKDL